MKRLVALFLVVMVLAAAIVVAVRTRLKPAAPPPGEIHKTAPIAPDLDSLPPDSSYFGRLQDERAQARDFFRGPESPLEDADRAAFQGLRYYEPDPAWNLRLTLEPVATRDTLIMLDTKGEERVYERVGRFRFRRDGQPQALTLFREPYHKYFFLPFKDPTNGPETYHVGRYLEPVPLSGGEFVLDFNRAYNPYCAYAHRWACPIPPDENRLTVPVRAGERKYRDD